MELAQAANRVLEQAESTNDWVKRLGEAGYPHGTWVSAREQIAGRGRAGRRWESPAGNLYLSLLARQPRPELWTWVPLTTACAAVSVARSLFPALDLRIKWPNDLWVFDREGRTAKTGGILCEASSFVVIGLGLNCRSYPDVDQPTTSLSAATGRAVSADELRPEIVAEILHRLEGLATDGPAATARDFTRWSALPEGAEIAWGQDGAGTVLGLGPAGELCVLADGREHKLYAEDVRIRRRA